MSAGSCSIQTRCDTLRRCSKEVSSFCLVASRSKSSHQNSVRAPHLLRVCRENFGSTVVLESRKDHFPRPLTLPPLSRVLTHLVLYLLLYLVLQVTGSISILGLFNDAVWLKKAKDLGTFGAPSASSSASPSSLFGLPTPGNDKLERIRELEDGEIVEEGKVSQEELDKKKLPPWASDLHPSVLRQLRVIFQRTPLTLLRNTGIHILLGLFNESELLLELFTHAVQDTISSSSGFPAQTPVFQKLVLSLRSGIILVVEVVKAALRLVLLWRNGGRLLTNMSIPAREEIIALASSRADRRFSGEDEEDEQEEFAGEDGERLPMPNLPNLPGNPLQNYRRYTLDHIAQLKAKLTPSTPTATSIFGEVLWILRPVIYVIMRLKYGNSWSPWMISLLVDVTSHRLSKRSNLSGAETDELSRRRQLLLLYILRSPFFQLLQQLFSPATNFAYSAIGKLPGMQTAWDFFAELLNVYRTRYFYLAGSASP